MAVLQPPLIIRLRLFGYESTDNPVSVQALNLYLRNWIVKRSERLEYTMSEKQTTFTVTDRRKFTLDGELRDPATAEEIHESAAKHEVPASIPAAIPGAATPEGKALDIDPDPLDEALDGDGPESTLVESDLEGDLGPVPTSQESADQHTAYRASSGQLDEMIRQANPGAETAPPADFEQVVQSFYLSAVIAMGAAAEPGQKPRIDIIGARQSIDMLAVLVEKTKGNLTDREQKLLQTALFNLRMMFLEITNSIAAQAAKPSKPSKLR